MRRISLVIAILFVSSVLSSALCIKQENIDSDTTWTSADSPVVIHNDLTIRNDAVLTINSGVEVRMKKITNDGGYEDGVEILIRNGSLICNGTKTRPVVFTSDANIPHPGDWGAIIVEYNNQFILDNTEIKYAKNGLWLYNLSSSASTSSSMEYLDISDCSKNGIFIYYSYLNVYHARITDNDYAGIKTSGPCYVTVNYSDIYDNRSYNFYNGSSNNINANNCWWGTTSSSVIESKIYDYNDSHAYGEVDFTPYLSGTFKDSGSVSTYSLGGLKGLFWGN